MKQWIAAFRLEAELILPADQREIVYAHPKGLYEVRLSNVADPEHVDERLVAHVISRAPDINSAQEELRRHIDKFLHTLSFVTSTGYRITRQLYVLDWSTGATLRECFLCTSTRMDQPFEALTPALANTVELLHSWQAPPVLWRALRWYASAVRSSLMEDQFQFFWFVIELIAIANRDRTKVTDKCVRCGGNLVCDSCHELSVHRPFEKQAIAQLLTKVGLGDQLIKDAFKIRNSLLHGEDRDHIEEEIQKDSPAFTFQKGVDILGRAAWAAILNLFQIPPGEHQPEFVNVSTYVSHHLRANVHCEIGIAGDPNDPQIPDIILPQVSWSLTERDDVERRMVAEYGKKQPAH